MGFSGEAKLRDRQGAELMSLEAFEVSVDRPSLSTELAKTAHTAYGVELCDRLCPPRQPEEAVFSWLDEFLARLNQGEASAERLRVFELGLLRKLGIGPSLDRCTVCNREDLRDDDVIWQPASGGVVCRNCSKNGETMAGPVRQALTILNKTKLEDSDGIRLDKAIATGCRRAILAFLHEHLHGPLRSLDFIEKMSSSMSSSR
jgi:DNA repair protein RecO (recombination protein O)